MLKPLFCVTPTIQFSNQLMKSFKKIYELKSVIPVQMIQPCGLLRTMKVA